jgi:hypothetical protein
MRNMRPIAEHPTPMPETELHQKRTGDFLAVLEVDEIEFGAAWRRV